VTLLDVHLNARIFEGSLCLLLIISLRCTARSLSQLVRLIYVRFILAPFLEYYLITFELLLHLHTVWIPLGTALIEALCAF
jgi:hypothetical protein